MTNFSSLPSARRPEDSRPAPWDFECRQPSFPPQTALFSRPSLARSLGRCYCLPSLTWLASVAPGCPGCPGSRCLRHLPSRGHRHSSPAYCEASHCWGSPRSQTQSPPHSHWWTSWSSDQSRHCSTTATQRGNPARHSGTIEWSLRHRHRHQGSPRYQYQSLLFLLLHQLH